MALAFTGLVLAGCFGAESGAADRTVDAFHEQMNAAQYHDMYVAASHSVVGDTSGRV